jgi:hypothetical protein
MVVLTYASSVFASVGIIVGSCSPYQILMGILTVNYDSVLTRVILSDIMYDVVHRKVLCALVKHCIQGGKLSSHLLTHNGSLAARPGRSALMTFLICPSSSSAMHKNPMHPLVTSCLMVIGSSWSTQGLRTETTIPKSQDDPANVLPFNTGVLCKIGW